MSVHPAARNTFRLIRPFMWSYLQALPISGSQPLPLLPIDIDVFSALPTHTLLISHVLIMTHVTVLAFLLFVSLDLILWFTLPGR